MVCELSEHISLTSVHYPDEEELCDARPLILVLFGHKGMGLKNILHEAKRKYGCPMVQALQQYYSSKTGMVVWWKSPRSLRKTYTNERGKRKRKRRNKNKKKKKTMYMMHKRHHLLCLLCGKVGNCSVVRLTENLNSMFTTASWLKKIKTFWLFSSSFSGLAYEGALVLMHIWKTHKNHTWTQEVPTVTFSVSPLFYIHKIDVSCWVLKVDDWLLGLSSVSACLVVVLCSAQSSYTTLSSKVIHTLTTADEHHSQWEWKWWLVNFVTVLGLLFLSDKQHHQPVWRSRHS